MNPIAVLNEEIVECRRCPRLVEWRERVAREKRKSFAAETYWGRPVPLFGDPDAERLIVGLAPAAHGGNRTGRMFTGDRSGDWIYRALHTAGVASQASSTHVGDGLELRGALIAATAHCAPPDNKPLPDELANCNVFLQRVLALREWKSILCLGGIAWDNVHRTLGERKPAFSHGATNRLSSGLLIVASYHPSQQNTFTGRLTEPMLDAAVAAWLD
ncbi:uracil-DNA glycosylase [Fimbriimonas ginsengisoli]|uniref:Type-5 uracil-DNA glycosylase n=1 Tax=Fimbriimonas ginsengisoli Gsoil 348 TaxID=661478 RepID=A0A068NYT6_FIMGI|nr:uracil-DNA glycosylase [Fimbriimonas ginsengisoli]AIE87389.1 uracil-DNA glycosylase superfamily protein [Fimbriimonas ginsengisoli Gsoil 348]